MCERQLDVGRRAAGGGQHGHRTETGIGDTLASVQARPVHPLEQTLSQGEAKHAHTESESGAEPAQEREYVRGIHLASGSTVCHSEIHRQCEVSGSWNASKTRII